MDILQVGMLVLVLLLTCGNGRGIVSLSCRSSAYLDECVGSGW